MELSGHHRDTAQRILAHPTSGNVEWRQVISLVEAIGEVSEGHDGKLKLTIGPETEVFHNPHGKDADEQQIVDLRRMLTNAGYADDGAVDDSRDRNYGDNRWGDPE
jgi:hypothetical protein